MEGTSLVDDAGYAGYAVEAAEVGDHEVCDQQAAVERNLHSATLYQD